MSTMQDFYTRLGVMLQVEDSQLQALAQLTRASFAQVMALQSDLGWDTWGAVAIQPA